jgi:transcriptional regulator with XRE-family HTH domain
MKYKYGNKFTLRDWLYQKRLSITFFAALLHVDRTYIHKLMKGQKIPSDKLMEKIREISLDEIYNKEDLIDEKRERREKEIPEKYRNMQLACDSRD